MAESNINTGGLEEAKDYMMEKEIPQLFESMMTALMYKKPTDHIEFLEQCLGMAKLDSKVKWHSFIEPLPPIPKGDGKVSSEHSESQANDAEKESTIVDHGKLAKNDSPLPPITLHQEMVSESENNTNVIAEKIFGQQGSSGKIGTIDAAVHDDVVAATEQVFKDQMASERDSTGNSFDGNFETAAERPWYAEYTETVVDMSSIQGKPVIFVLGGPGSGKGTQCAKIVDKFGFCHLSAGDLLRQEVAKASDIGAKIDEIMKEGQLVPQDVTICLLKTAMIENTKSSGFLIDGFPREIKQGKQFERQVTLANLVLYYDCPDEILIARLLSRAQHSGRIDDNEETIKKRLALFHEKTEPVIEHYEDIVATIDANTGIDEVFTKTCKALETRVLGKVEITNPVIFVLGGPGSGKRTQCTKLSEKYGLIYISIGDLLRAEAEKDHEIGLLIKNLVQHRQLVPQGLIIDLLKKNMSEMDDKCNGFLIDGFPREYSQGAQYEAEICPVKLVLHFDCPDNVLVSRVLSHSEHANRMDDNEETITKRLETYHSAITPILLNYQERIKTVDASVSMVEVFQQSCKFVEEALAPVVESSVTTDEIHESEAAVDNDIDTLTQEMMLLQDKEDQKEKLAAEEDVIVPDEETMIGGFGQASHIFKDVLSGKRIILALGGPDTGRHLHCSKIASEHGYTHIYTGDLLKSEIDAGTEKSAMLTEAIEKGEFIAQDVMLELISDAILREKDGDCFLIDGFPRTLQQAEQLQRQISDVNLVLYFSIPSLKMNEVLAYDDSPKTKYRVINFEEQTLPLVEHYKKEGILMEISTDASEEEVGEGIKKVIHQFEEKGKMAQELAGKNIFFVLGGPGSGKGTQCAKIVEKYGFCHLSTGDLLRDEVQSGSERAGKLKAIMEKGELVSQETVLELLKEAMVKNKDCKGFLIDGFPRDISQGKKFEHTVGKCKFLLYFECSNEVMVERLLGRAKTSGRVDDNEETIKKRLGTFEIETLPLVEEFKDRVKKVNVERSVDEIFTDVCSVLDAL